MPPNIDDAATSTDVAVREGSNVTMQCRANGSPAPTIRWKRDDNFKLNINKSLSVTEWESNTLELSKVSRGDMGGYLCIASNGIPPSVSKRIKLSIDCKYLFTYSSNNLSSSLCLCLCILQFHQCSQFLISLLVSVIINNHMCNPNAQSISLIKTQLTFFFFPITRYSNKLQYYT